MGKQGTGKSSIFKRFLFGTFCEKPCKGILAFEKKNVEVDGMEIPLMVWDVKGVNSVNRLPMHAFIGVDILLYTIDLTNPLSYLPLEHELDFLSRKYKGASIFVIANKADLLSEEELNDIFETLPIKPDYVISAKNNTGVEEIFEGLGEQLLARA